MAWHVGACFQYCHSNYTCQPPPPLFPFQNHPPKMRLSGVYIAHGKWRRLCSGRFLSRKRRKTLWLYHDRLNSSRPPVLACPLIPRSSSCWNGLIWIEEGGYSEGIALLTL